MVYRRWTEMKRKRCGMTLAPATIRLTVFTAVTPCRQEDVHRRFGEIFCFHLHGLSERLIHLGIFHCVPPGRQYFPFLLQWDPETSIRWQSLCCSNKFNIRSHYDWQQYLFAYFSSVYLARPVTLWCPSHFCSARLKRLLRWPDLDQDVHCKRQAAVHW